MDSPSEHRWKFIRSGGIDQVVIRNGVEDGVAFAEEASALLAVIGKPDSTTISLGDLAARQGVSSERD